jgi:hypothetical protein
VIIRMKNGGGRTIRIASLMPLASSGAALSQGGWPPPEAT